MGPPKAALVLAALALAGCVGAPAGLVPTTSLPATVPDAYGYLCPGGAGAALPTPCADVAIAHTEGGKLEEPYVAPHPRDADLWAVGSNVGRAPAAWAQDIPSERAGLMRMSIHITEDGGRSWRETFPPPGEPARTMAGPGIFDVVGDPALVFDTGGRLHVTGLASVGTADNLVAILGGPGDSGIRVFYTSSDDLGATWSEPVVLKDTGGFQDRNWIVHDEATSALYVVWQDVGEIASTPRNQRVVEVAWSLDRGATWRTMADAQRAPCARAGTPVLVEGTLLLACDRFDAANAQDGHAVYAFDAATGSVTLRGVAQGEGSFPGLVKLGGRLVMRAWECFQQQGCALDASLRSSADGGATWSPPVLLSALLSEPAEAVDLKWVTADAWGRLHLLAVAQRHEGPAPTLEVPLYGPVNGRVWQELHIVTDASFAPLSETSLGTLRSEDLLHPALPSGGDHFHGLAWRGDEALLVVPEPRTGTLAVSQVLPVGP